MLKHLRFDISEAHETKLPVRLINTINKRRLVKGYDTTPLRVKGDIQDVSIGLDNKGYRVPFLDEVPRILLLVAKMNKKTDELKHQYYDNKDISGYKLAVIEADLQEMEDRLEELEVRIRDL
ncbi:uncharacterized protein TNCV_3193321 [Trichonephila clavipes]|nr:uncharacterized protein TNCV_3193321 [Trichonephila clavipes]